MKFNEKKNQLIRPILTLNYLTVDLKVKFFAVVVIHWIIYLKQGHLHIVLAGKNWAKN